MPTPIQSETTGFQPLSAVKDLNLGFALLVTSALAYDPEKKTAVYLHEKMTGLEERPRVVVCPLGQAKPLFWFWAPAQEAEKIIPTANKKYAAWLKRQATQKH